MLSLRQALRATRRASASRFHGGEVNAILKYSLAPRITLEMPQGAKILAVQTQRNEPQMWALVDTGQFKVSRTFRVYPTGVEFDVAGLAYIGTFQVQDGTLVFHVFEETP